MAIAQDRDTGTAAPSFVELIRRPIRPETIAEIVARRGLARAEFDLNYKAAPDLILKARFARGLVDELENPMVLYTGFIPTDVSKIPPDQQPLVQSLEDRMHFLMIQKGHMSPSTMDPRTAERLMSEELQQRQNYRELFEAGWPAEVLGPMMTVDMAANLSDEEKIEELKSWTTTAMLREYMGMLTGKRQKRDDLTISDIRDRIPDRVFENPEQIKTFLIGYYIEQKLQKSVTEAGLQAGLDAVQMLVEETPEGSKKDYFQELSNRFYDIATMPLEGDFNTTILLKGQPKVVPSFEQRSFVYDFMNHGTRLVTAETGLGKTITFYLAMEQTDAERVLVVAPANGKKTWETEHKKFFKESEGVFIINGLEDIDKAKESAQKYIVIGQELLGDADHRPEIEEKVMQMLKDCEIDGGGVDEIGNLSNPDAVSTGMMVKIAERIRRNYQEKRNDFKTQAPIIGLTATPVKTELADMNVMMGVLYPDRYAVSKETSTAQRKTFSDSHLNDPTKAFCTLIGNKEMFRWENAKGVQEFSYTLDEIEASPFEDYLYSFIETNVGGNSLDKIRLLENCLFNPLLVKAEVRHRGQNLPRFDLDQVIGLLTNVVTQWKDRRQITEPQTERDFLSADRLVELGMGDMVLSCFFSDLLENGVDTIVEELTKGAVDADLKELRKFWKPRGISTKYDRLKELIDEALTWRELPDGGLGREKVFLVSPRQIQGRTAKVSQRNIKTEDGKIQPLYPDYELAMVNDSIFLPHFREWLKPHMDPELLPIIDGSTTLGRIRDAQIESYTDKPDVAAIFVNLPAAYQSRDYTINETVDSEGRKIIGVRKILFAPPWYFERLKQVAGRSQRQGQLVPMDLRMSVTRGMIEEGEAEAVLYTMFFSKMTVSGVRLTEEQQDFMDSKKRGDRIPHRSPDATYMRDALDFVRGAGEDKLIDDYLSKDSGVVEGKTHQELVAERFYNEGKDAYHTSGYNAELVARIIKKFASPSDNIATIGAGTLLLQRKLESGIDNIDINPFMMDAGWGEASQYGGRKITARASRLVESGLLPSSYKVITNDFALHWSKLEVPLSEPASNSERVKILEQMHRLLKGSKEGDPGGLMILTVPENNFDAESFEKFCNALEEHFGITVEKDFSGQTYGRSKIGTSKRLGWSIVGRKTGEVNLDGLDIEDLRFANESEEWVSVGKKKRRDRKSKGTPKNYPAPDIKLDFEQYEIVRPDAEKTILTYEDKPLGDPAPFVVKNAPPVNGPAGVDNNVLSNDTRDFAFLYGENRVQYKEYRNSLLRPVLRMLGLTMRDQSQGEEVISRVFEELQSQGKRIDSKITAYTLILREVRRIHSQNGKGVSRK